MGTLSSIFAFLCGVCMLSAPVIFVIFIIMAFLKNKKKKVYGFLSVGLVVAIIPLAILGMLTDPSTWCEHEWEIIETVNPTCTKEGYTTKHCALCGKTKTEYVDELGHSMRDIKRIVPTQDHKGEIIRQCERCGFEEVEELAQLPSLSEVSETTTKPTQEVTEPTRQEQETESEDGIDTSITFDEIYRTYEANELRADDTYKNNRYRITGEVYGISTGGLFNLTGGATLTMKTRVDHTLVFFYAEFEREQEEALKTIDVGDTITFEGECLDANSWVDCELIK